MLNSLVSSKKIKLINYINVSLVLGPLPTKMQISAIWPAHHAAILEAGTDYSEHCGSNLPVFLCF